jgi:hypothetical protein
VVPEQHHSEAGNGGARSARGSSGLRCWSASDEKREDKVAAWRRVTAVVGMADAWARRGRDRKGDGAPDTRAHAKIISRIVINIDFDSWLGKLVLQLCNFREKS